MTKTDDLEPLALILDPPTRPNTLYLDRDGVLNEVVLRDAEISSPRALEEFRIADDVGALGELSASWNLVIVTNQPDLKRGTIQLAFLEELHRRFRQRLPLCAAYICPHLQADGCACRKPAPGLIERFRKTYPQAVGREWMVGDGMKDRLCAQAAGVPFALRLGPHNAEQINASKQVIRSLWELRALLP